MFLSLVLSWSAAALIVPSDAKLAEIADSRAWHRLLHYRPTLFGGVKSQVDGPEFFFAENGKTDPLAELKATIVARDEERSIGPLKQSPVCAFPERYRFIGDRLGWESRPTHCEAFERFLKSFNDPQAVSLVFSSAYPNNPASMFGHTFLKIHSRQGTDLLDMGINYAATVADDENGFAFLVFGVGGGYRGAWSSLPYYTKVNEYANFESRDLWEYELNFTPEETRRLLAHLWELETTSFMRYYFFDENCSYQIMFALEVIRPDLDLTSHFLYVAPGETIKAVARYQDLIRRVRFRPSFHGRLHSQYAALTDTEKAEFFALLKSNDPTTSRSRPVLEAVAAYYDYMRGEHKATYKEGHEPRRLALLKHRATLGMATPDELARVKPVEQVTRPDLGHDSYAVTLGGGHREVQGHAQSFSIVRLKSSYHDLLNKDLGYKRYAHIDFPSVEFQWDDRLRTLRLEQLNLLATTSLHPLSILEQKPSFRFSSGLKTVRDYGCLDCVHAFVDGGVGASLALGSQRNLAYAFLGGQAEAYPGLRRGYRYGPSLETGVYLNLFEDHKASLRWREFWDVDQRDRSPRLSQLAFDQSVSLQRNLELRNTNFVLWSLDGRRRVLESRLEIIFFLR